MPQPDIGSRSCLGGGRRRAAARTGRPLGRMAACYICNNGGFAWHEYAHGLRPLGEPADYSGGRIERVDLATGTVERPL